MTGRAIAYGNVVLSPGGKRKLIVKSGQAKNLAAWKGKMITDASYSLFRDIAKFILNCLKEWN